MSTRFYFPSSAIPPGAIAVTPDAGWGTTAGFARRRLPTPKQLDVLANSGVVTLPNTAGTAAAGANGLLRQFISDSLAEQIITVATTLSSQCMFKEGNAAHNIDAARVAVYVVSHNAVTVRGTLLSIGQYGTTPNEFSTGNRNATVITPGTPCQNEVAVQAGDRLVVEVGVITSVGGTGTPTATMRLGDGATDLPVNDSQTADGAGWFETSTDIEFWTSADSHYAVAPRRPAIMRPSRFSQFVPFGVQPYQIRSTAGTLHQAVLSNINTPSYYVLFFDQEVAPVAGDMPIWSRRLLGLMETSISFEPHGLYFDRGMWMAISSTAHFLTFATANHVVASGLYF